MAEDSFTTTGRLSSRAIERQRIGERIGERIRAELPELKKRKELCGSKSSDKRLV